MVAAYDKYADEREANGEPSWRDAVRADFASRLAPGGRIVELGAGVGYTSRWFADQGFDVLATDLSPGNVTKCRDKGLTASVLDMHHIDLPAESTDGIWAASCLMHIADVELPAVLEAIRRLLVPGGWFWTGTWGGPDREGIWEDDFYEPKRFYSNRRDDRMRAFYEAHFDVTSFEVIDPEPSIDWHYQMALLRKPADAESD
jgi:SAM-dependent methyltransferase